VNQQFHALLPRKSFALRPSSSFLLSPLLPMRPLLPSPLVFRTLFQVPCPASPLLATATKTAGVCTNNSHSGTRRCALVNRPTTNLDGRAARFLCSVRSSSSVLSALSPSFSFGFQLTVDSQPLPANPLIGFPPLHPIKSLGCPRTKRPNTPGKSRPLHDQDHRR